MARVKEEYSQTWRKAINTQHPLWRLRPVIEADFDTVKALFLKLHIFNATLDPRFALATEWESHFRAYFEHALDCVQCLCLVAEGVDNKQPVGFVLASVQQDSAMWKNRNWVEITALYIEKDWRGQNLAEHLLSPVYEWAVELGHEVVQLYVTATNERAIRFYNKVGFRSTQSILRKSLV